MHLHELAATTLRGRPRAGEILERRVAVTLPQFLAEGEPVSPARLAERSGSPLESGP
jgi:hypothetical protein